jgi:hypothetical protein
VWELVVCCGRGEKKLFVVRCEVCLGENVCSRGLWKRRKPKFSGFQVRQRDDLTGRGNVFTMEGKGDDVRKVVKALSENMGMVKKTCKGRIVKNTLTKGSPNGLREGNDGRKRSLMRSCKQSRCDKAVMSI